MSGMIFIILWRSEGVAVKCPILWKPKVAGIIQSTYNVVPPADNFPNFKYPKIYSHERPSDRQNSGSCFYLNMYGKAWETQHEILCRMLREGRVARFLSADYGIPKADYVLLL